MIKKLLAFFGLLRVADPEPFVVDSFQCNGIRWDAMSDGNMRITAYADRFTMSGDNTSG